MKIAPLLSEDSAGHQVARGKAAGVVSVSCPLSCPWRLWSGSWPVFLPFPSLHKRCRRNEASPQVALVLWVHGSACLAAEVL